ncbi:MAG TPA: sulfurtransferase TusA family protein [Fimbriiglobus sp.]|jgi:tRNA 2-thiouridine synthesizing protein A|nr:sulfurtransferase TusA family protein [Fimbriiglobus sp.]
MIRYNELMSPDDPDTLPLRELHRIAGGACRDCRTRYTAHEAVWNVALGFKNAPRCLACLCLRLNREPDDLRQQLTDYVTRRDCYLRAWQEADRMETGAASAPDRDPLPTPPEEPMAVTDATWDAGDMGCGELVMELRIRLNSLAPGSVFTVRATDPAAPEDIPAWCRLTGHGLVSAEHPLYCIRRREG